MSATVKRSDLSTWKMVAGNEDNIPVVIDGNVKREWVGIGWIDAGTATDEDKAKYPTVIEDTP
jgi:hypothetical protein